MRLLTLDASTRVALATALVVHTLVAGAAAARQTTGAGAGAGVTSGVPRPPSAITLTIHRIWQPVQPGDVVVVHVVASAPLTRADVRVFDRIIPMWTADEGAERGRVWDALIGIDVEAAPSDYTLLVEGHAAGESASNGSGVGGNGVGGGGAGSSRSAGGASGSSSSGSRVGSDSGSERIASSVTLTVARKEFGVRRLRVDPKYSEPPLAVRERIAREAKQLNEIYATVTPDFHWNPPIARPVDDPTSSPFGLRSIFNGLERSRHNGVDFRSTTGTPVHAPFAGRIALAEDLYFTGNTVVIDHGHGLYTVFAHFERTAVETGQTIARGDVVGYVGATGRATGPHLHWSVRLQGTRVDPLSLMRAGAAAGTSTPGRE
jgi:murein DD-endopeptidase MepM/ murein hydrolase activator NlpD